MAGSGESNSFMNNLENVKSEINSNIELKKKSANAEEQRQLQELNSKINDLNNDANLHIRSDMKLKIAADLLRKARTPRRTANIDGEIRNMNNPTRSHFSTGSFNTYDDFTPSVLIAIDASGSMWCKRSILLGATGLLADIAQKLRGAKLRYAMWDDACDIPRVFNLKVAQSLANGSGIAVQPVEAVLQTSVGGGGTNIYSVADRLTPFVYPPEVDANGIPLSTKTRTRKYTPEEKKKYNLTFGADYDLIIIYSDFDFYNNSIPSDKQEMRYMFDQIALGKLCCICCDPDGERQTPETFKKSILGWYSYETWKKEIEVYALEKLYGNK
jgi:hypothetical protein